MNVVKGALRELVERRLWPIAVLLLAALVAAPLLLKSQPDEPVAPATPAVASDSAVGPTVAPLIAASDGAQGDRRVLGVRKDPFRPTGDQPQAAPDPESSPGDSSAGQDSGSGATGGSSGGDPSGGGSTGGGSTEGGGSAPAPESPPAVTPTPGASEENFDLYSLRVRVTEGESEGEAKGEENGENEEKDGVELKRLDPLLSKEAPAIIYLGLLEDEKTAVFLLDEGVKADGDGTCQPSSDDCQRVHLRKGETEFFTGTIEGKTEPDAVDFQLDILAITTRKTASSSRASAARATASTAGRRALRSRTDRLGRLRYDRRTGKLRMLSVKAYRTAMARASRRRAGLARNSGPRPGALWGGPFARATGRHAGLGGP